MESSASVHYEGLSAGVTGVAIVLWFALVLFVIVSMWKVFTKAGQPGWASIVPFLNVYIMLKIAGKPGWWLFLLLIPLVNLVISIVMYIGIAENFGKSGWFALGLILLPIIFFPILAFGSAEYAPIESA